MDTRILGLIAMALALLPLGAGAQLVLERHSFLGEARKAHATVVSLAQVDGLNENRGPVMYPVLQWRTTDGLVRTGRSNVGGFPAPLAVGDDVAVLYDDASPVDVRIDSPVSLWLEPAIFLLPGLAAFAGGVWLWRRKPHKRPVLPREPGPVR